MRRSEIEQRLAHLQGMTVQKQMVLQRRINYQIRCRKGKLIRCLSIGMPYRLPQTTCSHIIGVCKLFSCSSKQHMLFWLLKGAWLTCNRCPFNVLPTPFWSPIKHFFWTDWQLIDLLLITNLILARILFICRWSVWNYVMTFFCVVMLGLTNVNILYYSFSTLYQMCNLRYNHIRVCDFFP